MDYFYILDKIIRDEIEKGKEIAIYPLGKIGMVAKEILEQRYGKKAILIDNFLAKYNSSIISQEAFMENYDERVSVIICVSNTATNKTLVDGIKNFPGTVRNIKEPFVTIVQNKKDFFKNIKKLCKLKKVKGYELIRVGSENDGGYVMLDDLSDKNIAYSFGIGKDNSWDMDMADKGVQVYCYDPTIDRLPQRHERLQFYREGIAGIDNQEKNLYSLETILNKNNHLDNKHMILKMDVEGAEWDFLEKTSSEILEKFSQITFELHEITNIEDENRIIDVLTKLQKTHVPVWIHANNGGGLEVADEYQIPVLLEMTLVNKTEYEVEDMEYNCPIFLDSPNIVSIYEIKLRNW